MDLGFFLGLGEESESLESSLEELEEEPDVEGVEEAEESEDEGLFDASLADFLRNLLASLLSLGNRWVLRFRGVSEATAEGVFTGEDFF